MPESRTLEIHSWPGQGPRRARSAVAVVAFLFVVLLATAMQADEPPNTALPGIDEPSQLSDETIEQILLEGKILEMREIGSGVTRPMKCTLELEGRKRTAAFKTVEIQNRGVTRFSDGETEINFRDSYRYDRAAYVLDRMLGLHMVPVAVVRKVKRDRGAVVDWVHDAINERDRVEGHFAPSDRNVLAHQRAVMQLFDALIGNTDRHSGNQLWTIENWELHLIDHTRSFRISKKLPEAYEEGPSMLTRQLLEKLQVLERESLIEAMDGVIDNSQIKSLLARRDLILAKIAEDRNEYGDDWVFQIAEDR